MKSHLELERLSSNNMVPERVSALLVIQYHPCHLSWLCPRHFSKMSRSNVYFVYFHLKGQTLATFGTKRHQMFSV